eukprot:CAMPEP_0202965568 /NCGR_PEP_ID=MMETSP1396-20130829/9498_1 /ASSEMBLY_ACC=CAM_ASM_000872 /TAXON_ID= /ORGANISM="Pseudokeronopsis sp., Strain Brazil" /LENGTH=38 /DNA_ID= /DNA_START= /DNA_END= /DNA_ORIENTATION=
MGQEAFVSMLKGVFCDEQGAVQVEKVLGLFQAKEGKAD